MRNRALVSVLTIALLVTMCFGTTAAFADTAYELSFESFEAYDNIVTLETPESVTAKALGKTSIKVSWSAAEGAEGYNLYTYSSSSEKYVKTASLDSDTLSYTVKNLSAGTSKSFKVTSFVSDADGNIIESEKSSKASASTEADSVEEFLDTAESRLGKPYVSGAAGPNAFDCSGFVYWVIKNSDTVKVKISRSSAQGEYSQLKKYDIGTTNLSAAKPGDILFFGSGKGNIWHVGIYYGGGKQIHAFSTWGKVAVSPVSMSTSNKRLVAIVRLPMK